MTAPELEAVARAIADAEMGPLGYFPNGAPMRVATWNDHTDETKLLWRAQAQAAADAFTALGWRKVGEG